MKRPRKTNAERAKAKYLRGKKKAGKRLTPPEQKWLDSYENETARWVRGRWERDHEDLTRREAAGEFGPAPAVPMHTAPPVEGGGGPERFTALPMLPPAAPVDESDRGGVPPDAANSAGAAGGASPAGGSPSGGGGPEPLIDAPAAAPSDPAVLEAGARRFAAAVVALNTFGLAALADLFPAGSLPLPTELDELARSKESQRAVLAGIHAAAIELAQSHPWLAVVGPSPAAIVLGASSVSITALYVRHVRRAEEGAIEVEAAKVTEQPRERAGEGTLDFGAIFAEPS